MSKQTAYPLTFAEAEQIAKDGGFVEHKGHVYRHRQYGGWFLCENDRERPSYFMDHMTISNAGGAKFRQVEDPTVPEFIPPTPAWELQDYEPGKD